nr:hypothetical protein [uncultured Dysosmobacter sp.]
MENNLVHIKTKTGLEIDIDPSSADDMELLDACYEVQEVGNMLALPKVLRLLLTDEARAALYAHVRVNGRVPYEPLMAEIVDIMGAVGKANAANVQPAVVPAPALAPAPAPVPTVPPMASSADDKVQPTSPAPTPPTQQHIDSVMARLRAAMTYTDPKRVSELESATRAAIKVAKPESAWHLLNEVESDIQILELRNEAQKIVDSEAVQSAQATTDPATVASMSAQ